jgi:hypothetical protein
MYGEALRYSMDWYRLKQDSSSNSGKSNPPRSRSIGAVAAAVVPSIETTTYCQKKKWKTIKGQDTCEMLIGIASSYQDVLN